MTWFVFIGSFIIYLIIELAYNALPIAYTIEFLSMELHFTNPAFYLTGLEYFTYILDEKIRLIKNIN